MSISLQTLLDLPEIQELKGVPAGPPEHHPEGDAFAHTEMVVNLVLGMVSGNYSEDLCDIALVAAALHDAGKAKTDPAKWPKHYGHRAAHFKPYRPADQGLCSSRTGRRRSHGQPENRESDRSPG